jgi:hypothetical protein
LAFFPRPRNERTKVPCGDYNSAAVAILFGSVVQNQRKQRNPKNKYQNPNEHRAITSSIAQRLMFPHSRVRAQANFDSEATRLSADPPGPWRVAAFDQFWA